MARKEWTAAAVPGEVRRLRRLVCDFARDHGLPDHRTEDVALAVTEIVTNAVLHAHRGSDVVGRVHVTAQMERGQLVVAVTDDGEGLTPRDDSPGAGLGLMICEQIAAMEYVTPDAGGTRVELVFA